MSPSMTTTGLKATILTAVGSGSIGAGGNFAFTGNRILSYVCGEDGNVTLEAIDDAIAWATIDDAVGTVSVVAPTPSITGGLGTQSVRLANGAGVAKTYYYGYWSLT